MLAHRARGWCKFDDREEEVNDLGLKVALSPGGYQFKVFTESAN